MARSGKQCTLKETFSVNSLTTERSGNNFETIIFKLLFRFDTLTNPNKMAHRRISQTHLMIIPFWFRQWLGVVGPQAITRKKMSHYLALRWRQNRRDSVSNHQPHDCLFNRLFRRRSKKTSKLCVTGLCVGNSPGTGEFPAQMVSYAENASIWWRHHLLINVALVNTGLIAGQPRVWFNIKMPSY